MKFFPPLRAKPIPVRNLHPKSMIQNLIASKIRPFLVNYVTTFSGLALIFGGLGTGFSDLAALAVGDPLNTENLKLAGTQIAGGVGLLFARQQGK